jgi:cellulose synthase/poly-beta-1,6-N-acetylglucosamine synthase-like glycosyltransferase
MLSYCYAWLKTPETTVISKDSSVFFSVILPVRNEEENLSNCLDALLKQSYDHSKFEIIVVDDHSIDNTLSIVTHYAKEHDVIKFIQLSDNLHGKKKAIHAAIETARGEVIVTTDADCEMGNAWLTTIAATYKRTAAKMIIAPVAIHQEKNIFEKMQSLEFMALMVCGGASLFYKKATMCNGANLVYSKNVYREVGGFDGIDQKASGDDVLLMYKVKAKYPEGLFFLKSKDAIVNTKAQKTLKEFVHQRRRWASKSLHAVNAETKKVAFLIYFFNAYLFFIPLFVVVGNCLENSPPTWLLVEISLIIFAIKCFIDFLLLFLAASFFSKKRLLPLFIAEQIIYMMYVVIMGLLASRGKYEWKGRLIK